MSNLVYGVGFNSKGKHKTTENGKRAKSYQTWRGMMRRCYDPKTLKRSPTYVGCSVDERWHDFQDFAKWFYSNPYSSLGYQLDKDILVTNNKVYGPEYCVFVPKQLNMILNSNKAARGDLPQGVCWDKCFGKYRAQLALNGVHKTLGLFANADDAYTSYKEAKESYVKNKAVEWKESIDDRAYQALMNWQLTD